MKIIQIIFFPYLVTPSINYFIAKTITEKRDFYLISYLDLDGN